MESALDCIACNHFSGSLKPLEVEFQRILVNHMSELPHEEYRNLLRIAMAFELHSLIGNISQKCLETASNYRERAGIWLLIFQDFITSVYEGILKPNAYDGAPLLALLLIRNMTNVENPRGDLVFSMFLTRC